MLRRNAPTTEGSLSVPTSDCLRWKGSKNRSATISLPGASTTTTAMTAKNRTVLTLETSTARPPSIFEPRPGDGSSESAGPVPLVVILLLEGGDAQVLLQVLLLEIPQRPVLLHLAQDLVDAAHERVALLEEHPELLVPRVLADHLRVLDLEVPQVHRRHQVGDEGVDLAALKRALRVVRGVVDLGLGVGLHRLVYEVQARRPDLRAELHVLQVRDALGVNGRGVLERKHALGVVEVAVGEVHRPLALGGDGDLVYVEVVVLGAWRIGPVERLDHPLYGQVHPLVDLVGDLAFEAGEVLLVPLEPRRVRRLVGGDRQNPLLEERGVLDVARRLLGARASLRRSSGTLLPDAPGEQQARDENTDQDRSLHDAPNCDFDSAQGTRTPAGKPSTSHTAPSIGTAKKGCNSSVIPRAGTPGTAIMSPGITIRSAAVAAGINLASIRVKSARKSIYSPG